jgi:hypothetical protein
MIDPIMVARCMRFIEEDVDSCENQTAKKKKSTPTKSIHHLVEAHDLRGLPNEMIRRYRQVYVAKDLTRVSCTRRLQPLSFVFLCLISCTRRVQPLSSVFLCLISCTRRVQPLSSVFLCLISCTRRVQPLKLSSSESPVPTTSFQVPNQSQPPVKRYGYVYHRHENQTAGTVGELARARWGSYRLELRRKKAIFRRP